MISKRVEQLLGMVQYPSVRYTDRLDAAGAVRSVGSKGDSYDCETPACRPAA